jgi:predicted aconitase
VDEMQLTTKEKEMLEGKHGNAVKKSMGILVALGEIFGAKKLIPVKSVQISGVSYDNLGDAGLEFLNEIAKDGKVVVTTTLNPAGMDMENWKALGIPEDFAKKQIMVIEAFKKMGVKTTCTCTPYFIGNKPKIGDHIAWGESSAVTYANSVLGARTNKEGGPSTIASALTGLTPEYGFHLDKNRKPQVLVEVKAELRDSSEFGALGKVLGEKIKNQVPLIQGIKKANEDQLKSLSASIVTYGGAPLFHIEGITSEKVKALESKIIISRDDIEKAIKEMNDGIEDVDFIFIGCPHCSIDEIQKISELLKGKKVIKEFWIGVARPIKKIADEKDYSKIIEQSGAKFACDTCHVVAPLKGRFKSIATNSAKGVFYGRGKNNFKIFFGTMEECIKLAVKK